MQNPNSLVSKVFKAKYFQDKDFMEAKQGHNSSLMWRSLLVGSDLLSTSLIWRIGNGQQVKIWKDIWVPKPVLHPLTSPVNTLSNNSKVFELIHTESRVWNEDLISNLFSVEEANLIKSILLGSLNRDDKQIWHYTKYGFFQS